MPSTKHILASNKAEQFVINVTENITLSELTFCKFNRIHFVSLNGEYKNANI